MNEFPPADPRRLAEEFVAEAAEYLVGLWEIAREFEAPSMDQEAVRERTLDLVRMLLASGLVAGDPPYARNGYRPWPDQRPEPVIARIRSEWKTLGRIPNIPDIVWFAKPGPKGPPKRQGTPVRSSV